MTDRVLAVRVSRVAGIIMTFGDAATVFFPSGRATEASGKAEIREGFREIFTQRSGPVAITLRDVHVELVSADVAIVTALLRDVPSTPLPEPTAIPRRSFVLQRVNGSWLIVHLHAASLTLPAAKR